MPKKTDESKTESPATPPEQLNESAAQGLGAGIGPLAESLTVQSPPLEFSTPGVAKTEEPQASVTETSTQTSSDLARAISMAQSKFPGAQMSEIAEMRAELAAIRSEFTYVKSELGRHIETITSMMNAKKDTSSDVLMATMRVTAYCPECQLQLDGGSQTASADAVYTHPMGSAATVLTCKYIGKRFSRPKAQITVLADPPSKRALPVA